MTHLLTFYFNYYIYHYFIVCLLDSGSSELLILIFFFLFCFNHTASKKHVKSIQLNDFTLQPCYLLQGENILIPGQDAWWSCL